MCATLYTIGKTDWLSNEKVWPLHWRRFRSLEGNLTGRPWLRGLETAREATKQPPGHATAVRTMRSRPKDKGLRRISGRKGVMSICVTERVTRMGLKKAGSRNRCCMHLPPPPRHLDWSPNPSRYSHQDRDCRLPVLRIGVDGGRRRTE